MAKNKSFLCIDANSENIFVFFFQFSAKAKFCSRFENNHEQEIREIRNSIAIRLPCKPNTWKLSYEFLSNKFVSQPKIYVTKTKTYKNTKKYIYKCKTKPKTTKQKYQKKNQTKCVKLWYHTYDYVTFFERRPNKNRNSTSWKRKQN